FGIKKGGGWSGETYSKKTAEQDKSGKVSYIIADFRKYDSIESSVKNLIDKYTVGTGWEEHNRYSAVLGHTDYKKCTQAIFDCKYATDIRYPKKLNDIIEEYDLTKYDKGASTLTDSIMIDPGHGGYDPGGGSNSH